MAEEEQEQQLSKEEAEMRLQQMRAAVQEQMRQINILEMDAAEHRLVLEALDPLQGGRKCFRMVGTVIVERTVSDVKPALTANLEQMKAAVKKLTESCKKQQLEADAFAAKHRLSSKQGAAQQAEEQEGADEGSSGVLI
ncbi:hypothetical protein EMIHUDRAFT_355993 [Emiliania huxleyi CCMP1516]|uniref:Prefoldin subunit 2 n=2 Tax=Emiliania huxleyi TaxID=2903 RepID=A0A0D3IZV0_EMIH1|nr:hypothetical protein EMIHUDRAFT_355993 [Emiliania huxleyi CCMP1516]EOD16785.1 hypothetical protein EMIHUDRAFT_355993 [Emiliania huxleyi CCMP1516]|eukprot:XP_005769214.1 hypothetical protein EMIHUDRAFT_355993 [Emiliania huxleyi CCMP1516]